MTMNKRSDKICQEKTLKKFLNDDERAKREKGWRKMKFTKGLLIGGLITTGLIIMYNDTDMMKKNKMIKKGKQFMKKMGI
jgi:hypothetical protein